MKIDGFIPADPKIAYEEGSTFTYETKYGDVVVIAKMAGNDNEAFSQNYQKVMERHERESRLGNTDANKMFRDLAGLYHDTVIIKWSTTVKSGGKAISSTRENFVDLITTDAMRPVWGLFIEDVSNLANFQAKQEEDTAKN